MTDYISRDVAIATVFMAEGLGNSEYRNVNDIAYRLRLISAADVVERKHGKWIVNDVVTKVEYAPAIHFQEIHCSECNWHVAFATNFCPNCGARMVNNDV